MRFSEMTGEVVSKTAYRSAHPPRCYRSAVCPAREKMRHEDRGEVRNQWGELSEKEKKGGVVLDQARTYVLMQGDLRSITTLVSIVAEREKRRSRSYRKVERVLHVHYNRIARVDLDQWCGELSIHDEPLGEE
jgi:hypothetical protein